MNKINEWVIQAKESVEQEINKEEERKHSFFKKEKDWYGPKLQDIAEKRREALKHF